MRNEYYLFKEQETNTFNKEKNDLSEKPQITQKKNEYKKNNYKTNIIIHKNFTKFNHYLDIISNEYITQKK